MKTGLEQAFHVDGFTVFDQEYWNRFVRELAARFRGLEDIKISWDEVSRQGIDVALERINNTLAPAAERIHRLTELGFLIATSDTPATLEAGAIVTLEVVAGDARDLFTPSPFLLIGRPQSFDDYAVARLRHYDNKSGALELQVVTVSGDPGPHDDWTLGALAGSTIAQLMMLEEGRGLAATILAAVEDADRHRAAAAVSAGQAQESRAAAAAHEMNARELLEATIEAARPLTLAAIVAALGFTPETTTWLRKSAAYTAKAGERIMADTSGAAFTLTLPAAGGTVEVQDVAGTWPNKNLTITGGAKAIRGSVGPLVCDQAAHLHFIFDPTADVWIVTKAQGVRA